MTWFIMILLMAGGAVVQTVIPTSSVIGGAKLPVLLSVVLYYALTRSVSHALAAAFIAGFLHDVLSHIPLGDSVFCFCVAAWLAGYFKNMVLHDSIITTFIFGGIANVLVTFFFYVVLVQNELIQCTYGWVALKTAGALLLGVICTPVVFHLARWIDRTAGTVEMEQSLDGVE